MRHIAFAGNARSGKSTLARKVAANYGLEVVTGSDIIRGWAEERGATIGPRTDYAKTLRSVREERGSTVLLETQLAAARGAICIDSLKIADEHMQFKALGGLTVAVWCPLEKRFARDQHSDDGKPHTLSIDQFIRDEEGEYQDPDRLGLQTITVMQMADVHIDGSGTFENSWRQFEEKVSNLL